MIIPQNILKNLISTSNIQIKGILHIGAHECEELEFYNKELAIDFQDIIWIEANVCKVAQGKQRNIPNIYNALITDSDDILQEFNVANNSGSSSALKFNTHTISYPEIRYVESVFMKTVTLDSFFKINNLNPQKINAWNFVIQGSELLALKGALQSIRYVDLIIIKIFTDELYSGCVMVNEIDAFLDTQGFIRIYTQYDPFGWGEAVYIRRVRALTV